MMFLYIIKLKNTTVVRENSSGYKRQQNSAIVGNLKPHNWCTRKRRGLSLGSHRTLSVSGFVVPGYFLHCIIFIPFCSRFFSLAGIKTTIGSPMDGYNQNGGFVGRNLMAQGSQILFDTPCIYSSILQASTHLFPKNNSSWF